MTTLLATVFVASLLGSLHCAGMCGPFCAIAVGGGRTTGFAWLSQLAYHGGRLVSYSLLGAIAGAMGALLNLASALAGLQPLAIALAGGVMVLIGGVEIARLRGWQIRGLNRLKIPTGISHLMQRGQRYAAGKRGVPRAVTIGLLTTLLPCGWLYAFLVTAAGSGGALQGALVMAVFWLGTVPVLLSLGISLRRLAAVFGDRLPMVTAVALIVVGFVTLSSRAQLSAQDLADTVVAESAASGNATPDPEQLPPCCRAKGAQP